MSQEPTLFYSTYRHPKDKCEAWSAQTRFIECLNKLAPEVGQDLTFEPLGQYLQTGIHKIDSPPVRNLSGKPNSVNIWENFNDGYLNCLFEENFKFSRNRLEPYFIHRACAQRYKKELEYFIVTGKITEEVIRYDCLGRSEDLPFSPCPQMVALWDTLQSWSRSHHLTEAPGIEKWVLSAGFRTVCSLGINITDRSKRQVSSIRARDSGVMDGGAPSSSPDRLAQLRRTTKLLSGYLEDEDPDLYSPSISLLRPPTALERTLILDLFAIKRRELRTAKLTPQMKSLATWSPVDQSREDFLSRVEEDVHWQLKNVPLYQNPRWREKAVGAALMEAKRYCDYVERTYQDNGWRKPKKRPELVTHLEWTVRFQVKEETYTAIADSAQVEISTVKRGVDKSLDLIGLVRRPDTSHVRKIGRSHTISNRIRRSLGR